MTNRLASLFELDELIAGTTNGHQPVSRSRAPRAAMRSRPLTPTQAPAPSAAPQPSPATRNGGKSGRRKGKGSVQRADNGAAIRCEHDVAFPAVEKVNVPPPPAAAAPQLPPQPSPIAQQLGSDEYDVEAFDDTTYEELDDTFGSEADTSSDSSMRLQTSEDAQSSLEMDATESVQQSLRRRGASSGRPLQPLPRTFAAQMNAVEEDLAELAARARTPAPSDATVDSDAGEDANSGADGAPAQTQNAPPPNVSGRSHAIFDQMAQGLAYATEFRLPPVQLSQMFSALDQQLDAAEHVPNAPAPVQHAPSRTIDSAFAPAEQVELPSNETLIRDLVALPVERTESDSADTIPTA